MKIVTANRLSDGRVLYLGGDGRAVANVSDAAAFDDEAEAEAGLALAAGQSRVFVNPYLVEVKARVFSGRDRLKESIRAAGPTVGHSLDYRPGVAG